MTALDFIAGTYGTTQITGTDAITGSFAGFVAGASGAVIAAISIKDESAAATYFGTATLEAGQTVTVPGYTNGIFCTSITLTSGSLMAIKGS
jgi:hypothetical protein